MNSNALNNAVLAAKERVRALERQRDIEMARLDERHHYPQSNETWCYGGSETC